MSTRLKVRWALAAAIAKASHICIDGQKELYIADNSSDGKSVVVMDPNDNYKAIKVDLQGRDIKGLKFWKKVPLDIQESEPLYDYYTLLCFNLTMEFKDEQGILELRESVFKAWEEDIAARGMVKNSAKFHMAYLGMPDPVISASYQIRDILDDPNFLEHDQAYTLTTCVATVAHALHEFFGNGSLRSTRIHPDLLAVLELPVDTLACRIHNNWRGASGADERVPAAGGSVESKS